MLNLVHRTVRKQGFPFHAARTETETSFDWSSAAFYSLFNSCIQSERLSVAVSSLSFTLTLWLHRFRTWHYRFPSTIRRVKANKDVVHVRLRVGKLRGRQMKNKSIKWKRLGSLAKRSSKVMSACWAIQEIKGFLGCTVWINYSCIMWRLDATLRFGFVIGCDRGSRMFCSFWPLKLV